jgi:hypothetical protein
MGCIVTTYLGYPSSGIYGRRREEMKLRMFGSAVMPYVAARGRRGWCDRRRNEERHSGGGSCGQDTRATAETAAEKAEDLA